MSGAHGNALVMGLGSFGGGVGAARYLAQQGWRVCVTDLRTAEELSNSVNELNDLSIRYVLGEHSERDFLQADLVVASPAVPPSSHLLKLAREQGARISTEIELFLEALEARLILVTGTQGKSSTCHLIETLLGAGHARVFLGGNIGVSLLPELAKIRTDDFVVLELSSYQLEALASRDAKVQLCQAQAVCVTNLVPDHLERHGGFAAYGQAKQHILSLLAADGVALIGPGEALDAWLPPRGQRLRYGTEGLDLCIKDGCFQFKNGPRLPSLNRLMLPGEFQQHNALAALGVAASLGITSKQLEKALPLARGLQHRLQCLGEFDGLRIHDNAVSTTPDSTIAALRSLPKGLHLMMGGRSKGLPLEKLAQVVHERAERVTLFGEARAELAQALLATGIQATQFEHMENAVQEALAHVAQAKDLLFSPACSSFDAFPNFKARAQAFRALLPLQLNTTEA